MKFLCKHNYFSNNKNVNYGNGTKYVEAKCIFCGDERLMSIDQDKYELNLGEFDVKRNLVMDDENYQLVSDGYHTFEELYTHRMVLFAGLCNSNKEMAWKSKLHHDSTMFENYFIVGMNTKQGQVSYHYHIDSWGMFKVKELPTAPEWDGHTTDDVLNRLISEFVQVEKNEQKDNS